MEGFIAGSVSGFIQILIGHPFDTYKTWLQTNQKNRNIKNIYFGIKYPLYNNCVINSILFGTNNTLSKYISNPYITGFLTGIPTSIICCPVELFKIRKQCYLSKPKTFSEYFIGFRATLLRESIGCSIYLGSYDYLYKDMGYNSLYSGGISGVLCWFLTHPIDTIKSRIQQGKIKNIKEGLTSKNLWKGISFSLYRALLVNSIGFYIYQNTFNYIKSI